MENTRTLSLKDLIITGVCIMSPLAPFTTYYQIANGSFGMVSLVYLVGMVAMLLIANSFVQLSKIYPVSGSAYTYVQKGLNPYLGFLAGWANLCLYFFIPTFTMVVAGNWLKQIAPDIPLFLCLFLFIAFSVYINRKGTTAIANLNKSIFYVELVLILLFIGLLVNYVFIEGQGSGGFSLTPIFQPAHFNLEFLGSAITLAIFGFIGFDTIGASADKAKNPKKNIGRAVILSILLAGLFFFVQTYLAGLAMPNYEGLNPNIGLFEIVRLVGGETLFLLLLIINVIAYGILIPTNVHSTIASFIYNMSKDDSFPGSSFFVKLHPKYKTPTNIIYFVAGLTLLFTVFFDGKMLMSAVNFCAMILFILLNYTVIKHLFFEKKLRGLNGFIFNLILPLIALTLCVYLLTQFTLNAVLLSCGLLLVGVIIGHMNLSKK